jgi:hypothetical protein
VLRRKKAILWKKIASDKPYIAIYELDVDFIGFCFVRPRCQCVCPMRCSLNTDTTAEAEVFDCKKKKSN